MEFLEHKSGDTAEKWLRNSGKVGPVIGAALGALPQCGFSAAASGLYTGRIITTGTLIAVWLSTSDEMLPILISEKAPLPLILKILLYKVIVAILAGIAIDTVTPVIRKKKALPENEVRIEDFCEREGCRCNEHFFVSALRHTLKITVFILLFTFLLNLVIHGVGEDKMAALVLDRPILGNFLASVVGLIPNCASSIILTQLYLEGIVSVGAMLSGLFVNAGIGLALLFRNNRPLLDSFRITAILWLVGTAAGILADITPIGTLF